MNEIEKVMDDKIKMMAPAMARINGPEFGDGPEFSQSVCQDGAAILMNGRPLTIEQILEMLRRGAIDSIDAARYRKLREKHWNDGGIAIVKKASNIKLGSQCLSQKLLDDALDAEA